MILVTGRYGQLCNQLFTFANLIAFAMEHKLVVVNPEFRWHANKFEFFCGSSACVFYGCHFNRVSPRDYIFSPFCLQVACWLIRKMRSDLFISLGERGVLDLDNLADARVRALADRPLHVVSGFYFVANQAFSKHSDRIREIFMPVREVNVAVDRVECEARSGGDVLVGVHVRQGDYRTFRGGLSFYSIDEYLSAMREVEALFPDKRVKFLVCSDEDQRGRFRDLNPTHGPGDPVSDLYSLARCDYLIGPGSTFTQWASFFGSVPRYSMSWKWEKKDGRPITPLRLENFHIHKAGFGSYR